MAGINNNTEALRYTNPETGYKVFILDGEDLLTEEQESSLAENMIPITQYGNCAFDTEYVTGMSSYDYAVRNYTDYFKESGTLFLIDMGNREIKLYNSRDIEKAVNPSYANSITDNVYTYATKGDFYTCATKVFEQEYTLLQGGRIAQPMKYISCALLALILALLVNYFIVRFKSKNTKTPQQLIMAAVAATALVGSTAAVVTSRTRKSRGSSGGGGGSFGGGGGGGFSGGGHSF